MERVFSGKKVEYDRIVEIEQNGSVVPLPLEPSLEIADHSPDGFNWGYNGSGSAQLSLGILYEVTGDAELARSFYQMFKWDHVSLIFMFSNSHRNAKSGIAMTGTTKESRVRKYPSQPQSFFSVGWVSGSDTFSGSDSGFGNINRRVFSCSTVSISKSLSVCASSFASRF